MKFLITISIFICFCFNALDLGANCGSATCPLNENHPCLAGQMHLSLAQEYINQNQIYVGSSLSYVGALPNAHNEVRTLNERTLLKLQYGISDAFGMNIELPFIHRNHQHIEGGIPETFNFSGVGDMVLTGQYVIFSRDAGLHRSLNLIGGAKIPTGATHAKGTDGEQAEVTIQPGTGSLDLIFGVNYRQTIFNSKTISGDYSELPLIVGISYNANGKGTNSYRIGKTLLTHIGTEYRFVRQANFLFQINAMFRGFSDVGSTGEFAKNTGGTWIFVSPGLSLLLSDFFSVYSFVQIPAYINVHGIQQAAKFNLQFGLSVDIAGLK